LKREKGANDLSPWERLFLFVAAIPFIYYSIALYSSWRFFRIARLRRAPSDHFTPPVSNLKPVRGLDPETYQNFASYCRQDYPEYEVLFCTGGPADPAVPVIRKLMADFPACRIRLIFSDGHTAVNDKVAKLRRLVEEAKYEIVVINDADVRVEPGYLRSVVAPLENPNIGAVTCMYLSTRETNLIERLQTIGMLSDFYPGLLVAWQLDGVKFALGQTIVTTRARIRNFGGYESLENRPADDLLVGRLVAEQGCEVVLLPYAVNTVPDFGSLQGFWDKRTRWMIVMRHMRPWGHVGLIFTFGLAWSLAAIAVRPTLMVAAGYLGAYAVFRCATTYLVGVRGLKQPGLWKKMPLIPLWDATASAIWLASFFRRSVRWRGVQYHIRDGKLILAPSSARRTL
jgi:ceramide glucosyltransferase